ncbi:hypothetical protein [Hyalangium sp.]|uniref:tetratricopeptide repeat protein n=1 Tax=Hyalangium sp. TaxID=2028555 RepID=UPI002D302BB2|nr:hypothetical protein [Hyalangium sp.]HYI02922.1 hypothetical protein [Hyalangium sp.]
MHHVGPSSWSRWSALTGLSVLLLHLSAAAQGQRLAKAYIQEARNQYEDLEYERALVELHSAQQRARTQEELVFIYLFKGILLGELGRKAEASAAFKEALLLRPGAPLPLEVSPKIRQQFEAVDAALTVAKPPSRQKAPTAATPPSPMPAGAVTTKTPSTQEPRQAETPTAPPSISVVVTPEVVVNNSPHIQQDTSLTVEATPGVSAAGVYGKGALSTRVLVPASAGGALMITGGIFWGLAKKEYSRLESADPSLATLSDVKRSASHGSTYQKVGFSLMGAGLVGLGLAVGLYGMGEPDSPIEFGVGTNGTLAVFHGRWR